MATGNRLFQAMTGPSNAPSNLTDAETQAFSFCLNNNQRLEQEKLPQSYVDRVIVSLLQ